MNRGDRATVQITGERPKAGRYNAVVKADGNPSVNLFRVAVFNVAEGGAPDDRDKIPVGVTISAIAEVPEFLVCWVAKK